MKVDEKFFLVLIGFMFVLFFLIGFVFCNIFIHSPSSSVEENEDHYAIYDVEPPTENYVLRPQELDENVDYCYNDPDRTWTSTIKGSWDNATVFTIKIGTTSDNGNIVSGSWSILEYSGCDNYISIPEDNVKILKQGWFVGPGCCSGRRYKHITVTENHIYINGTMFIQVSGDNYESR